MASNAKLPLNDNAAGALLGLAVGDALGTTLEFEDELRAPRFPELGTGPHREVVGRGPFHLNPGEVTDDTQMAICLWRSLTECRGFSAIDAASRYLEWSRLAFDVGGQIGAALAGIERGEPPPVAARTAWEATDRHAAGNGSLMRTAPIGVYFAQDPARRRRASLEDSAVTHFDPRCGLACAAFNAAVAAAAIGGAPERALLKAAESELEAAAGLLSRSVDPALVDAARGALHADLRLAKQDDPQLYGPEVHLHEHQGFVRVAFRLAFWELLHAPTIEAGLVDVVNRGGDADTNGAIAGALLGAYHGRQAIPARWLAKVLKARPSSNSKDVGPRYHPREFAVDLR